MAGAEFEHVGKRYGEVVALSDFTLSVNPGELITVLGPSGCGKSTLLRITAGLESLTQGAIRIDGHAIEQLPPPERNVAMVFQSYALYPHMSVRGNIEFPLRMRGVRRDDRRRRANEVAELLELGPLLERRPGQLSGGQRQRVALARALVRHPALFLLDEPLSNLDVRLRSTVRQYIKHVQRRLAVTTLYVTHDQGEAMTLGDRIVVMSQGRIQQADPPVTLYEKPANVFVAAMTGTPPMNLVAAHHADAVLRVADQTVALTAHLRDSLRGHQHVTVGIRPEAFVPARDGASGLVAVADPDGVEVLGSETLIRARIGQEAITARLPGIVREVPRQLIAPVESLHLFAENGDRVALEGNGH